MVLPARSGQPSCSPADETLAEASLSPFHFLKQPEHPRRALSHQRGHQKPETPKKLKPDTITEVKCVRDHTDTSPRNCLPRRPVSFPRTLNSPRATNGHSQRVCHFSPVLREASRGNRSSSKQLQFKQECQTLRTITN